MSITHPATLTPLLFAAFVAVLYYRRIRRQFGRQRYTPRRAMARVVLLGLVACGLLAMAFVLPHVALAILGGLAAGGSLGALGLHHTHLERVDGECWYTPNPWIGGALSLVLVGRLAWRWGHGAFAMGGGSQPGQNTSPLTMGILAIVVGFYVVNGAWLALRARALTRDPAEAARA